MKNLKKEDRRAASTVELALLLPFLVYLFIISVDFGRIFYFTQTIENCARNGAMYASDPIAAAQSPYQNIQQASLSDATNLNPQPTVTSANGTDGSGNPYVAVTVSWQFNSITNFPGIPTTETISRTVQVRVAPTAPQ